MSRENIVAPWCHCGDDRKYWSTSPRLLFLECQSRHLFVIFFTVWGWYHQSWLNVFFHANGQKYSTSPPHSFIINIILFEKLLFFLGKYWKIAKCKEMRNDLSITWRKRVFFFKYPQNIPQNVVGGHLHSKF